MANNLFVEHEYRLTVRFHQGYRFLDHCGEALVNLERSLHEDWIPTEAAPKGGSMRNDTLGMVAFFNAEQITVQQSDFVSFEVFREQACSLVEILRSTFRIDRYISPAFAVIFQRPFTDGDADAADRMLRDMGLITISPHLRTALGGESASLNFTLLAHAGQKWHEVPCRVVRRIEARVVRQIARRPFDDRLLRRATLLSEKHRAALVGLQRLRDQHPMQAPVAIDLNLETVLEGEIDKTEFPLYDLVTEVRDWADQAVSNLPKS